MTKKTVLDVKVQYVVSVHSDLVLETQAPHLSTAPELNRMNNYKNVRPTYVRRIEMVETALNVK